MRFLYLNAGLYLNDLYNLVKRKSKSRNIQSDGDTRSLCSTLCVGAINFLRMCRIFRAQLHRPKRLSLIITTTQPQTNLALLLIVFLYPILWGIGLLRQRRHEHGSRKTLGAVLHS